MYIPDAFAAPDADGAWAVMDAHPFALLASQGPSGLIGTHLPLLLDRSRGAQGVLVGHLARANDHWRSLEGSDALAVFSGPHAYVSPRWYAAGPAVPTWNYIAVHAYGRVRLIEEPARLQALLADLTRRYEGEGPWRLEALPERFVDAMRRGIVGLELEITRLDAKFKLSQNRPAEDRRRVERELAAGSAPGDAALAAAMRRFVAMG